MKSRAKAKANEKIVTIAGGDGPWAAPLIMFSMVSLALALHFILGFEIYPCGLLTLFERC